MANPFDISFSDLPAELPLFPLSRVILLPRVHLPLNVFEPRYIAMVEKAMASKRLIGIIQPAEGNNLSKVGCAGRIVSLSETDDGRYLITLKGICRFQIRSELPLAAGGFRVAAAEWAPYADDLQEETGTEICRDTMMGKLSHYLDKMGMVCDQWDKVKNVSCEYLISTLSLVCPFNDAEKQALLEAKNTEARAQLLLKLMDECTVKNSVESKTCH
jgi:Lon protease-like protein